MQKEGVPELAIYSFSTTALMFMFMLIVTESTGIKKTTDEEMLLSLPIQKGAIITAKVLYYLIFDFVVIFILVYPAYIMYGIIVEGTIFPFATRGLVLILLCTLFGAGISGIIATFLSRLTMRLRHSGIIQSIFGMALMVIFVIVYIAFSFTSQNSTTAVQVYEFYPIQLLSRFILEGSVTSLLIMILCAMIPFVLSVMLKAYFLGKQVSTYQSKNHELSFEESTIRKSLYKKEMNKYFSIPIYVSNTAFGPIFMIMIAILITVMGKPHFIHLIENLLSVGYIDGEVPENLMKVVDSYFNIGVVCIMAMMISFSPTTAASISLEGKELWILKAHPIPIKDVFISKILVNISIGIIPAILSSILLSTQLGIAYLPILCIVLIEVLWISSVIGLYANLSLPKLNWESEVEAVKQGIAVLLSMGLNLICILAPIIIINVIGINSEWLMMGALILIYVGVGLIWTYVLKKKGMQLYQKL
ncbi:MAG: hypothetical protein NC182_04400 [Prevotella sp.]|nr:hypothetical protein [Staphylococcus sp.]MCM1350423.1 hypothetical protein [Prevotella sp.]